MTETPQQCGERIWKQAVALLPPNMDPKVIADVAKALSTAEYNAYREGMNDAYAAFDRQIGKATAELVAKIGGGK